MTNITKQSKKQKVEFTKKERTIITWIFNYWQTLKHMGITEKELIKKMNTYFSNLMNDIYPPYGLDLNVICPKCKHDQFFRPMTGDYKYKCAACGYLVCKKYNHES